MNLLKVNAFIIIIIITQFLTVISCFQEGGTTYRPWQNSKNNRIIVNSVTVVTEVVKIEQR